MCPKETGDSLGNLAMRSSAFVTVCVQPGGPSQSSPMETGNRDLNPRCGQVLSLKNSSKRRKKTTHAGFGTLGSPGNYSMIKILVAMWFCERKLFENHRFILRFMAFLFRVHNSMSRLCRCSGNSNEKKSGCFRKHRYDTSLRVLDVCVLIIKHEPFLHISQGC